MYSYINELPSYISPFSPLNIIKKNIKKKKLAFVLPLADFGGVEKVTQEVAAEYASRGYECHCFIERLGYVSSDLFNTKIFKSLTYLGAFADYNFDSSSHYFGSPDVIISNTDKKYISDMFIGFDAVIFCNSFVSLKCAAQIRKNGVKTIAYVHTHDLNSHGFITGWPNYVIGYEHKLDKILCCSKTMSMEMAAYGVPNDKLFTVVNSTNFPIVKKKIPPLAKKKLLFMGRLDIQKGLPRLESFLSYLVQSNLNFEIKIAGSKILDNSNFSDSMKKYMIGPVYGSDVVELLDWADFLLLPSYWEGLPLTVLESLARGVIPICSPVGDLPLLAKELNAIRLVDWDSPRSVENEIFKMSDVIWKKYADVAFSYSKKSNWSNNLPSIL